MDFFIVLLFIGVALVVTEPFYKVGLAIRAWFEQKKFDMEMEQAELDQERYERMYNNYINRKKK